MTIELTPEEAEQVDRYALKLSRNAAMWRGWRWFLIALMLVTGAAAWAGGRSRDASTLSLSENVTAADRAEIEYFVRAEAKASARDQLRGLFFPLIAGLFVGLLTTKWNAHLRDAFFAKMLRKLRDESVVAERAQH